MVANDQKAKGQGKETPTRRIKPIRDLISDHDGSEGCTVLWHRQSLREKTTAAGVIGTSGGWAMG